MADNAQFDYVVIGSGSAGSVITHRLIESGEPSVCVLEAGGKDWNPFIHIPAGFIKTIVDPSVNWLYELSPVKARRDDAYNNCAARRWAAPVRSTGTSTTVASAWTSMSGRRWVTEDGRMPRCSRTSNVTSVA